MRKKNVEHIDKGLFEIHLYCWEDIVDLIDENRETHDYYVKNQNYKSKRSVKVMFANNTDIITLTPKFKRIDTHLKLRDPLNNPFYDKFLGMQFHQRNTASLIFTENRLFDKSSGNLSYSEFQIVIHNDGSEPLEEFKLILEFSADIDSIAGNNFVKRGFQELLSKYRSDVYVDENRLLGKVVPVKKILVGDETYTSDSIYIKPLIAETKVILQWKLISMNFKCNGELTINFEPNIIVNQSIKEVNNESDVKIIEGEVEDVIEFEKV